MDKRKQAQYEASIARELLCGRVFRHFKGNHYIVMDVAVHSETAELLVVYRGLHDSNIWVRPYKMFLSPVDREKYPDAEQMMRFERHNPVYGEWAKDIHP